MAQLVRLTSGFLAHRLTEKEQDQIWGIVSMNTSPVGKHSLFTPRDNREYFVVSEKDLGKDKFEDTIRANGKTFKVRYTIYDRDEKVFAAVRKAYGV